MTSNDGNASSDRVVPSAGRPVSPLEPDPRLYEADVRSREVDHERNEVPARPREREDMSSEVDIP
jgi:hypothetical protein